MSAAKSQGLKQKSTQQNVCSKVNHKVGLGKHLFSKFNRLVGLEEKPTQRYVFKGRYLTKTYPTGCLW